MADKHHSGRATKSEQKKLNKEQKETFGMSCDRNAGFDKAVIAYPAKIDQTKENTYIQNGRIENQLHALDKGSPVRKEYEKFLSDNNSFLDAAKKIKSIEDDTDC